MPFIKIMDKQYLEEETNMQNDEEEEDDISLDDLSFDDLQEMKIYENNHDL